MEKKDTLTGLRANCLGFSGVTAMAIALISPTMTAALIIPLMYSNAGNASWLAYFVRHRDASVCRAEFDSVRAAVNLGGVYVSLRCHGVGHDDREYRRLVPHLGLPVYRHRRDDGLHDLRLYLAPNGRHPCAPTGAVYGLRREHLVP